MGELRETWTAEDKGRNQDISIDGGKNWSGGSLVISNPSMRERKGKSWCRGTGEEG